MEAAAAEEGAQAVLRDAQREPVPDEAQDVPLDGFVVEQARALDVRQDGPPDGFAVALALDVQPADQLDDSEVAQALALDVQRDGPPGGFAAVEALDVPLDGPQADSAADSASPGDSAVALALVPDGPQADSAVECSAADLASPGDHSRDSAADSHLAEPMDYLATGQGDCRAGVRYLVLGRGDSPRPVAVDSAVGQLPLVDSVAARFAVDSADWLVPIAISRTAPVRQASQEAERPSQQLAAARWLQVESGGFVRRSEVCHHYS